MASFLYNSFPDDLSRGHIEADNVVFKMLLVTSSYTANKDTHTTRADVTNEITGTGYTGGGEIVDCTVAKNTTLDRITLTFDAATWPTSTLTAAGAVIYVARGGASSADQLVGFIDFGGSVSSTAATFTVGQSLVTIQN
jgi:hypothetical protein